MRLLFTNYIVGFNFFCLHLPVSMTYCSLLVETAVNIDDANGE